MFENGLNLRPIWPLVLDSFNFQEGVIDTLAPWRNLVQSRPDLPDPLSEEEVLRGPLPPLHGDRTAHGRNAATAAHR